MTTASITHKLKRHQSQPMAFPVINWKMVYSFVFCTMLLLLILYVVQINHLTQGTYLIKDYNRKIDVLSSENKNLEARFANSSFLQGVQQQAERLSFQKTGDIQYVQILENSLASAK